MAISTSQLMPFDRVYSNWEAWYAWHPVKLNTGKYCWLTTVYRRYASLWAVPDRNGYYEYGNIFDVMK